MDIKTPERDGELFPVPLAGSTTIFAGHIVCANATGFAVPGSNTTGFTTLGVADGCVENTGANGAASLLVRRGKAFHFANNSAAPVTQANVGKACYVADSQTVAATGNVIAGTVLFIADGGVWVRI